MLVFKKKKVESNAIQSGIFSILAPHTIASLRVEGQFLNCVRKLTKICLVPLNFVIR